MSPRILITVTVRDSLPYVRPVVEEMQRRGWHVTVGLSPSGHGMEVDADGMDVRWVPMSRRIRPLRDLASLAGMVRVIREIKPDVVIGSTPKAAPLSLTAARLLGVPVRIFQVRGARWDGRHGLRAWLVRLVDRWAAAMSTDVIAVSPSLRDVLVAAGIGRPVVLGRGGSKGVDTVRFRPKVATEPGPPVLGYVGRLSPEKGVAEVLTVFDRCRQAVPATELVVVGPVDPSHPIDDATRRALHQAGVRWEPFSAHIENVLRGIDILVFPSVREGLPNVVIEAGAVGVPTVGYNTTGMRDAVLDGQTGFLVPLADVDALAAAAVDLLDPQARSVFGAAAVEYVRCEFNESEVVGRFVDWVGEKVRVSASINRP